MLAHGIKSCRGNVPGSQETLGDALQIPSQIAVGELSVFCGHAGMTTGGHQRMISTCVVPASELHCIHVSVWFVWFCLFLFLILLLKSHKRPVCLQSILHWAQI